MKGLVVPPVTQTSHFTILSLVIDCILLDSIYHARLLRLGCTWPIVVKDTNSCLPFQAPCRQSGTFLRQATQLMILRYTKGQVSQVQAHTIPWDLRFSQRPLWTLLSCGMWRRAGSYQFFCCLHLQGWKDKIFLLWGIQKMSIAFQRRTRPAFVKCYCN